MTTTTRIAYHPTLLALLLFCFILFIHSTPFYNQHSTSSYNHNELDLNDQPTTTTTIKNYPFSHPNLISPLTTSFSPQATEDHPISFHFFPTPLSTNRTLFHATIQCEITNQNITTNICTPDLSLRVFWTTSFVKLKSAWLQSLESSSSILNQVEVFPRFTIVGFPLFDQKRTYGTYKELYVIGEFIWEEFDITSKLSLSVEILGERGSHRNILSFTEVIPIPMMPLEDVSVFFDRTHYSSTPTGSTGLQVWIKDIPWPFSIVYFELAGWIGVPDERIEGELKIKCQMNGANFTHVQQATRDGLTLGFYARGIDPITNNAIIYPTGTDVVLLCSGLELHSKIDVSNGNIPAIGIQVQVFTFTRHFPLGEEIIIQDEWRTQSSIYYQAIIHSPDPTYTMQYDELFQNQFAFFHINDTNREYYYFRPMRQFIWTGNTKQHLTNENTCLTHYQMRFGLEFIDIDDQPFTTSIVPFQIGLGATEQLRFYRATYVLTYMSPDSQFIDDFGDFQILADEGAQDTKEQRQQIRFQPSTLQPPHGFERKANTHYELLISLSLRCNKPEDDPAVFTFSFSPDDIKTIDNRNIPYVAVFGYSHSPFQIVNNVTESNKPAGIRAIMNRVNVTEDLSRFKDDYAVWEPFQGPIYRYMFDILLTNIPGHVKYINEIQLNHDENNNVNDINVMNIQGHNQIHSINNNENNTNNQYNGQNHITQHISNINFPHIQHNIRTTAADTDPDEHNTTYEPFKYVEFSFHSTFGFQGNFTKCKINDDDGEYYPIIPKTIFQGKLYDILPGSTVDTLAFEYQFITKTKLVNEQIRRQREEELGLIPKLDKDIHIYSNFHLNCSDVFVVNYTSIHFDKNHPTPFASFKKEKPSWHDDDNKMEFDPPRSIGFHAKFSHYPTPTIHSNTFFLASLAEFDVEYYSEAVTIGFFYSMFTLTVGTVLFGVWIYSGTSFAARNSIHRSTASLTRVKNNDNDNNNNTNGYTEISKYN